MHTILVSVDLSDATPLVVEQASQLATDMGARLVVLHVGPPEADFAGQQLVRKVVDPDKVPERLRERFDGLAAIEHQLRDRGIETESVMVLGKAIGSILDEARRVDAQMIVVGSHRRGAVARLLGSVSEGILRAAVCPVLIVPVPEA
jgi:nucleotide-binding universal stress UspA family protein